MNYVQIFVNNQELDGIQEVDLAITYAIADTKDISKKTGYRSTTIQVPKTKNNERILGIPSDLNVFSSFDKNTGYECKILQNSSTILNGVLYVISASDSHIEVAAVANNASLKTILGEQMLSDLRLYDLNHTWSDTNVFNSWTANGDYIYPLINYGLFRLRLATLVPTRFYELYPAMKVERLLKQICEDNNIILDTKIFNVPYIQKLIMPFCNADFNHTDEWVTERYMKAINSVGAGINYFADSPMLMNTIVSDASSQFSLVTDEYTPNEAQRVDATLKFYVPAHIGLPEVGLQYYDPNLVTWVDVPDSFIEVTTSATQYVITINNIALEVTGFTLRPFVRIGGGEAVNILLPEITIQPAKKVYRTSTVDLAENLPKMKQIDFIKQLVSMFNLEISYDDNKRTLSIHTQEQFYTGQFVDWSDKLDIRKLSDIAYVSDDVGSILNFKYTDASADNFISQYKTRFNEPLQFGDGQEILNNDYNSEETDIADLKMRPVYSGKSYTFGIKYINIPSVYETTLDPGTESTATDPFFLIYYGNVDIGYLSDNSYGHMLIGEGAASENSIPLCYFAKKKMSAGIDAFDVNLCFDMPREEFGAEWNGRGLKQECYADMINNLNKLRKVTGQFNIKDTDIEALDFRKFVYLSHYNTFFKLNKVKDYNPAKDDLTEVELIRLAR